MRICGGSGCVWEEDESAERDGVVVWIMLKAGFCGRLTLSSVDIVVFVLV
jgi:hypothetical protein